MKLSSEAATLNEKEKTQVDVCPVKKETCRRAPQNVSGLPLEQGKVNPISINVPDSDFHDFDKDRKYGPDSDRGMFQAKANMGLI
jgi:hypothetical protein